MRFHHTDHSFSCVIFCPRPFAFHKLFADPFFYDKVIKAFPIQPYQLHVIATPIKEPPSTSSDIAIREFAITPHDKRMIRSLFSAYFPLDLEAVPRGSRIAGVRTRCSLSMHCQKTLPPVAVSVDEEKCIHADFL